MDFVSAAVTPIGPCESPATRPRLSSSAVANESRLSLSPALVVRKSGLDAQSRIHYAGSMDALALPVVWRVLLVVLIARTGSGFVERLPLGSCPACLFSACDLIPKYCSSCTPFEISILRARCKALLNFPVGPEPYNGDPSIDDSSLRLSSYSPLNKLALYLAKLKAMRLRTQHADLTLDPSQDNSHGSSSSSEWMDLTSAQSNILLPDAEKDAFVDEGLNSFQKMVQGIERNQMDSLPLDTSLVNGALSESIYSTYKVEPSQLGSTTPSVVVLSGESSAAPRPPTEFTTTAMHLMVTTQSASNPILAQSKTEKSLWPVKFMESNTNEDRTMISKQEEIKPNQDLGTIKLVLEASINEETATSLASRLQTILWGAARSPILQLSWNDGNALGMRVVKVNQAPAFDTSAEEAASILSSPAILQQLKKDTGIRVVHVQSVSSSPFVSSSSLTGNQKSPKVPLLLIIGSIVALLLTVVMVAYYFKHRSKKTYKLIDTSSLSPEVLAEYQDLCRSHVAVKNASKESDNGSLGSAHKHNIRARTETTANQGIDVTTGHAVLKYMEDHLANSRRLAQEWEMLCLYKPDQTNSSCGKDAKSASKNRHRDVLPYDHNRVLLKVENNKEGTDYINASYITDTDPRCPAYIATQGPLSNTVADFWQMIWEQGVSVIVNLTKLTDMGLTQCHRYWPEQTSELYHVYEVNLISEHVLSEDYLVRSFYIRYLLTNETRTVTQFHFLTWPELSVPPDLKVVLEFRRMVNACFRGQGKPVVVHCNSGIGRTGTYLLLDMVLRRIVTGAREFDLAATLEHLRDQRADMVKTKAQFEFALAAVAEEVTSILQSNDVPQQH